MLNSTSKMLFVTENINDLRSKVTSKKGTTEAALKIFEKNNFNKIIKDAIKSAKDKSIDIANKKK
jgi:pyrroline-5-carboxylate reductase